jgi:CelD/BcsL family acetyltransferase involved in cellulose biosynthesis
VSGSLSARVLTDVDAIARRAPEYRALSDRSPARNPFAGPEWTLNWYSAFLGPRRRPWLIEVFRDDDLIGIVPMWEQRSALGTSVLRAVGRGRPWLGPYELAGGLAAPGEGRDVGRAAVQLLCERSDEWNWAHVALGDMAPWLEPDWLVSDEFLLLTRHVVTTVVLELEPGGPCFRPKRNLRESIRRAKNRLDRDHPANWTVTRVVKPVDVHDALARLVRLHHLRSERVDKAAIHADVLADAAVRDFFCAAVEDMAAHGLVSIYELTVDDQVIASQLALHTQYSTHFSLSGQLETAWSYSAITYLQWLAVQDAHAAGHDLVDFSSGPIQSKLRWSDQTRSYHEFAVVAPRRAARLSYWAELPRISAARMLEASRANRRSATP